jgi:subtilase family serine protease
MLTSRMFFRSALRSRKNSSAARRQRSLPLCLQTLETREIPSVVPVGLTPMMLKHAYGIDTVTFSGIAGNGAGQTIALVMFGDDPGMVSSTAPGWATSDLKMFDMALGIPDPPSFLKINQTGGTVYPTPSAGASSEISLDVEYAHAMAPLASIILVEATTASFPDLVTAATYASHIPGVTVVSNSYGAPALAPEFPEELAMDKYYAVPGVTFVFSTGDFGAPGHYPAYSPNVVAVGGTKLTLAGAEYGMETGWSGSPGTSGSGGGISVFENKPAYQSLVPTPSATKRTIPRAAWPCLIPTSSRSARRGSTLPQAAPAWRLLALPASSPSPIRAGPSMAWRR